MRNYIIKYRLKIVPGVYHDRYKAKREVKHRGMLLET